MTSIFLNFFVCRTSSTGWSILVLLEEVYTRLVQKSFFSDSHLSSLRLVPTFPSVDPWYWVKTGTHRGSPLHSLYSHLTGWEWCLEILGSTHSRVLWVPVDSTVPLDGPLNRVCLEIGHVSGLQNRILTEVTSCSTRGYEVSNSRRRSTEIS